MLLKPHDYVQNWTELHQFSVRWASGRVAEGGFYLCARNQMVKLSELFLISFFLP